jgi:hypothetical protein
MERIFEMMEMMDDNELLNSGLDAGDP